MFLCAKLLILILHPLRSITYKLAYPKMSILTLRGLLSVSLSERLHIHFRRAPAFVSDHLSRDWLRDGLEAQRMRGRQ